MQVKELIKLLSEYPENLDVVLQGYEGGYTENLSVQTIVVKLNHNKEWYYGEHEIVRDECLTEKADDPAYNLKKVLAIRR
jgi:hypothetical protein